MIKINPILVSHINEINEKYGLNTILRAKHKQKGTDIWIIAISGVNNASFDLRCVHGKQTLDFHGAELEILQLYAITKIVKEIRKVMKSGVVPIVPVT